MATMFAHEANMSYGEKRAILYIWESGTVKYLFLEISGRLQLLTAFMHSKR